MFNFIVDLEYYNFLYIFFFTFFGAFIMSSIGIIVGLFSDKTTIKKTVTDTKNMFFDSLYCVPPERIILNNLQVPVRESDRLDVSGFSQKY